MKNIARQSDRRVNGDQVKEKKQGKIFPPSSLLDNKKYNLATGRKKLDSKRCYLANKAEMGATIHNH